MRTVAHDLLQQIADRSKSRTLTEEVRRLDPTIVDRPTTSTDKDAATGSPVRDG
jgi:hypothetical protein